MVKIKTARPLKGATAVRVCVCVLFILFFYSDDGRFRARKRRRSNDIKFANKQSSISSRHNNRTSIRITNPSSPKRTRNTIRKTTTRSTVLYPLLSTSTNILILIDQYMYLLKLHR